MSFNDGFNIRAIPYVLPLPGTASMLVSSPDGSGWIAEGIVDNAISASVYVIETIVTNGNIDGNGAPEDPVILKQNISLTSVTASFNGDGNKIINITASNITNFTNDVRTQLTGSQYVGYDKSSGTVSLPFTGSIIGTTPVILGQTTTVVTGLASVSSSIGLFNQLTGANVSVSVLSASTLYYNNLVEGTSATQVITSSAYQIIPSSALVKISASSNFVLNSTPTMKISGYNEGLKIWVVNVGPGTITLKDETKTTGTKFRFAGAKDVVLNEWESLQVILTSGSTGLCWVEISRGAA